MSEQGAGKHVTILIKSADSMGLGGLFCSGCRAGKNPDAQEFNSNLHARGIDGKIGVSFLAVFLPRNLCGQLAMGIPCSTINTPGGNEHDTGILITGHGGLLITDLRHILTDSGDAYYQPCTQPSPSSQDDNGYCYYTGLGHRRARDVTAVLVAEVRCFVQTFPQYRYLQTGRQWWSIAA